MFSSNKSEPVESIANQLLISCYWSTSNSFNSTVSDRSRELMAAVLKTWSRVLDPLMGTLKSQSNGPSLYSNTVMYIRCDWVSCSHLLLLILLLRTFVKRKIRINTPNALSQQLNRNVFSLVWKQPARSQVSARMGLDGLRPAQTPLRCTKCNSPPINGQCTIFILYDVEL